MYCSSECKASHENFIHRHTECNKKLLAPVLTVCTKMLLTAISIAGSFDELLGLINDSVSRTVFDFDLSHPEDPTHEKNLLSVIHSMAMSKHSELVITERMKTTFDFPPFKDFWSTEDERELLIECFHKQFRIRNTNQLEMGEHTLDVECDEPYWYAQTIGSGLCPFASLFNHSCDANVKRVTVDNKIAFVVGQPIAAGEQLFISYGYSSYRMSREARQNQLNKFSFTCECVACTKNYPELTDLPKFDSEFSEPSFDAFTVTEAVSEFRKNCEYIEKNIKQHPSYETTRVMVHNDHILYQISKTSFIE